MTCSKPHKLRCAARAHLAHALVAERWSLVIVRLVHDLQVLEGVVVARAVQHGVWRHGGAIAGITFSRAVAKKALVKKVNQLTSALGLSVWWGETSNS